MTKKLTKKEKNYQASKKYSFQELELAFGHALKLIKTKDEEIEELKTELARYEKIFENNKQTEEK